MTDHSWTNCKPIYEVLHSKNVLSIEDPPHHQLLHKACPISHLQVVSGGLCFPLALYSAKSNEFLSVIISLALSAGSIRKPAPPPREALWELLPSPFLAASCSSSRALNIPAASLEGRPYSFLTSTPVQLHKCPWISLIYKWILFPHPTHPLWAPGAHIQLPTWHFCFEISIKLTDYVAKGEHMSFFPDSSRTFFCDYQNQPYSYTSQKYKKYPWPSPFPGPLYTIPHHVTSGLPTQYL